MIFKGTTGCGPSLSLPMQRTTAISTPHQPARGGPAHRAGIRSLVLVAHGAG
jgi:hypothetical protein